jgi:thiol-disulfide isomerase/thioredoxin
MMMKYLLITLITILTGFQSFSAPIKKIRVKGTVNIEGESRFGIEGYIYVLRYSEWVDTIDQVSIKSDGSFSLQVPDSLVGYHLYFEKPGCANKYFPIYPELGDYQFNITLNPVANAAPGPSKSITWLSKNGEAQEAAYNAYWHISEFGRKMVLILTAALTKDTSSNTQFEGIDLETEFSQIKDKINNTTNPELRKVLLIEYLCIDATQQKVLFKRKSQGPQKQLFKGKPDLAILELLINEVSPASGLWNIERDCIRWLVKQMPLTEEKLNYYERVITEQATPFVAASALYGLAQRYQQEKRPDDFGVILTRLVTDFPNAHPTNRAKTEFGLFSSLAVGKPVPHFAVESIDKPGEMITSSGMMGKTYLIEFWALWCKGCLMAIPEMEKAYRKYNKKGFEIVSILLDKNLEPVKKFRETRHAMPWVNAFEPAGFKSELARNFEVSWIPRSVLVGPDGKILAINLEFNKLVETVALHINK